MDVHQLVNIFCDIDDFCNELEQPKLIGKKMNNTNLPVNRVIFSQNQTKTVSLKLNLC